jgi:hypothetical protein
VDVLGIDFTSRPRRRKPIVCLPCRLDGNVLRASSPRIWTGFEGLESALHHPGPWIAGIDFPFGQSRRLVQNLGWPQSWAAYVRHARSLGRARFRAALDAYRAGRPNGDKEHRRRTDIGAGAISPQKLYGVPVGLMFFEGAPRLLEAGVSIPHLREGDVERIAVEAYPGMLARALIGRRSYKHETKSRQDAGRHAARRAILEAILDGALLGSHGLVVEAPGALAEDPSGDQLDALLCAVQAAWAWQMRNQGFGAPASVDPLEGWIADPTLAQS